MIRRFPELRGCLSGFPIIRTRVLWGLCRVPLFNGYQVQDLRVRVQGLDFSVCGLGFRVLGLGLKFPLSRYNIASGTLS